MADIKKLKRELLKTQLQLTTRIGSGEVSKLLRKNDITKTRFSVLHDLADSQNVVLKKKTRGYSLCSNVHFVVADCPTLDEVEETLREPSFQK